MDLLRHLTRRHSMTGFHAMSCTGNIASRRLSWLAPFLFDPNEVLFVWVVWLKVPPVKSAVACPSFDEGISRGLVWG